MAPSAKLRPPHVLHVKVGNTVHRRLNSVWIVQKEPFHCNPMIPVAIVKMANGVQWDHLNAQIVNPDDFVRMQRLDVRVAHQALVVIKLQPNARNVRQDGCSTALGILFKDVSINPTTKDTPTHWHRQFTRYQYIILTQGFFGKYSHRMLGAWSYSIQKSNPCFGEMYSKSNPRFSMDASSACEICWDPSPDVKILRLYWVSQAWIWNYS